MRGTATLTIETSRLAMNVPVSSTARMAASLGRRRTEDVEDTRAAVTPVSVDATSVAEQVVELTSTTIAAAERTVDDP